MFSLLRALLLALVLIAGLAFHSRNHQAVRLDFYALVVDAPLSWVAVGALAFGALLGIGVMLPRVYRLRRAVARETKRANTLSAAVSSATPTATDAAATTDGR